MRLTIICCLCCLILIQIDERVQAQIAANLSARGMLAVPESAQQDIAGAPVAALPND